MHKQSLTGQYLTLQSIRDSGTQWFDELNQISHAIHFPETKRLTLEICIQHMDYALTGEMEKVKDAALTILHATIVSGEIPDIGTLQKVDDAFSLIVNTCGCMMFTGEDILALIKVVSASTNGIHITPAIDQYIKGKLELAREGIAIYLEWEDQRFVDPEYERAVQKAIVDAGEVE